VQADQQYRSRAEDIAKLKVRNTRGEMVPLGAVLKVKNSSGPDRIMHYNSYLLPRSTAVPRHGLQLRSSRGRHRRRSPARPLPKGMAFEWTELKYQQAARQATPLCSSSRSASSSCSMVLGRAVRKPAHAAGDHLGRFRSTLAQCPRRRHDSSGSDNNIFTQIGLIVLVGLACKNAILIVEFAKVKQDEGLSPDEAAVVAAKLRLRPILMTSIAFIAGVWPLVASHGCRCRNAQGHGRRRLQRHDRRHLLRPSTDPRLLFGSDGAWLEEKAAAPQPEPTGHVVTV